jgi:beta-glucosidase
MMKYQKYKELIKQPEFLPLLKVTFDLENTGKYKGTEVVQLYVQDKVGSVTRPVKELKGFMRVQNAKEHFIIRH